MNTPLVSVICLCYNQKDYVGAAIRSVLTQTYRNIELIVVDDASNDGSQEVIKEELIGTTVQFIELEKNIGNCAAFNKGYELSKGAYLIDLAADDLLLPFRIEIGLGDFMKASAKSGIHFSDAFMINVDGSTINTFYERGEDGQLINTPPSGDIFQQLIEKYFICPPTMMFKREELDRLNGYDEHLSYEDFDFWIRSSREFEYIFNPAPLVKKRDVPKSLGKTQFSIRSKHFRLFNFGVHKLLVMRLDNRTVARRDKSLLKRVRLPQESLETGPAEACAAGGFDFRAFVVGELALTGSDSILSRG